MTGGSERGTTTRKLVRQEWKPLGGRRVVKHVAMPAGQTIPDLEWTDDLPGGSEVVNEVIGYAELPSRRKFPAVDSRKEFGEKIEAEATFVQWIDGGVPEVAEGPVDDSDDEQVTFDETEAVDDAADDDDDGAAENSHEILTVDGWVEYDPDDEPYILPSDAEPDDVAPGVVYAGRVDALEQYGVFVHLTTGVNRHDRVSGLLHKNQMALHHPRDFEIGEIVGVTLEDRDGGLSFVLDEKDLTGGITEVFPNGN